MMFVQRNEAGQIVGCFVNAQDFAVEELADDAPEVVDFLTPPLPSVSRFQARAALHLAGLLPQVEALMADPATPMLAKLAWQDAQEFKRNSPTIAAMAGALGLTDQQLDELFTTAAGIDA